MDSSADLSRISNLRRSDGVGSRQPFENGGFGGSGTCRKRLRLGGGARLGGGGERARPPLRK